jgi:hypothetical protein
MTVEQRMSDDDAFLGKTKAGGDLRVVPLNNPANMTPSMTSLNSREKSPQSPVTNRPDTMELPGILLTYKRHFHAF